MMHHQPKILQRTNMFENGALIAGYTLMSGLILYCAWIVDHNAHRNMRGLVVMLSLAIVSLYLADAVTIMSMCFLVVLIFLSINITKIEHVLIRRLLAVMLAVASLALAVHLISGFSYYKIEENVLISSGAQTININANIDKAFAGIILLIMAVTLKLPKGKKSPKADLYLIPFYTILVLIVAYLTGLDIDIKLPQVTLVFIFTNLIFSVITEEAFFRVVIQNTLINTLKNKVPWASGLAIVLTSILFGLAHIAGGWHFVILATFAGLIYGYAYHRTGRITVAIITHLSVNVAHFFLLVYPMPL